MVVAEGHQFDSTMAYGSNDAELWGEGVYMMEKILRMTGYAKIPTIL